MFKNMRIKNFIIIDNQEINFKNNFNILTGKTGAGKSVLIESFKFICGNRASSLLYKDNTKNVVVEATLFVTETILEQLNSLELDNKYALNEEIIVQRTYTPSGKNIFRIDGEIISSNEVKQLFNSWVDIYSQHDSSMLRIQSNYLALVDSLLTVEHQQLVNTYHVEYLKYRDYQQQLAELIELSQNADERIDFLKFKLKEITNIDELVDYEEDMVRLKELEAIKDSYETNNEIIDILNAVTSQLQTVNNLITDEAYGQLVDKAKFAVEEISYDISKNLASFDEFEFKKIQTNVQKAKGLVRKYNSDIQSIINQQNSMKEEISKLEAVSLDIDILERKINQQIPMLEKLASEISGIRQNICTFLMDNINKELVDLDLNEADFKIVNNPIDFNEFGIDNPVFTIKMNVDSDYTAIDKTASGGEFARFMLAFKKVLANDSKDMFIIFDEIDTGVSGEVATKMALKMREIAENNCVLTITHLLQVAALGQSHFRVEKVMIDGTTNSIVTELNNEQRIEELASMISDGTVTENAKLHATKLLKDALGGN